MLRFHYESAEAQLLAWADVMQGPQFFDENIDMANRRATIKAMVKDEVWRDLDPATIKTHHRITNWSRPRRRRLGRYTLNGHLIPFSRARWDRITLDITERGFMLDAFGAAQVTYLNVSRDKGYTANDTANSLVTFEFDSHRIFPATAEVTHASILASAG
jgi:hypothetical protein